MFTSFQCSALSTQGKNICSKSEIRRCEGGVKYGKSQQQ